MAKKCSSRGGGGGVISQNAMQVTYISIMHCSLLVISLLICCQKEILRLAPAYIVKLQGILGYYPLPSWHKHYLANVPGLENFLAKDPPVPPPRHEHFLAYQREVCNRYSNCLHVSGKRFLIFSLESTEITD